MREISAAPVMLCLVRYARSDKNAQLSSVVYIDMLIFVMWNPICSCFTAPRKSSVRYFVVVITHWFNLDSLARQL